MTSTLWELSLLQKHFHTHVSQAAASVAQIPPGGGAGNVSGVINTAMTPAQLAGAYSFEETGLFRPPPQSAAGARKGGKLADGKQPSCLAWHAAVPQFVAAASPPDAECANADASSPTIEKELRKMFRCDFGGC